MPFSTVLLEEMVLRKMSTATRHTLIASSVLP